MTNVTTMKDVPWDNGVTAAALSHSWVLRIPMGCHAKNKILGKYYSDYSDKDGLLDLLLAYLFAYWLY